MSLKILDNVKSIYCLPEDNLIDDVMIPAFQMANNVRCMVGYFHSSSFAQLAPGLSAFINSGTGKMQLLASPVISDEDQNAMKIAIQTPAKVIEQAMVRIFEEAQLSEYALVRHHYDCLAYLLAVGRLEFKLVLMKVGIFHHKVWIFSDQNSMVAVHGSSNMTTRGLLWNCENVQVSRLWRGEDSKETIASLEGRFEKYWNNKSDYSLTVQLPEALKSRLLTYGRNRKAPTVSDFYDALKLDLARKNITRSTEKWETPRNSNLQELTIPIELNWEFGDFAHQGKAVFAWEHSKRHGILAMATGSGKTNAALIAATRLQQDTQSLLVVIAAPYKPLIEQWQDEVRAFGVEPVPLDLLVGSAKRERVAQCLDCLQLGLSKTEVLVVTHNFLCHPDFYALMANCDKSVAKLLIADEVHNLGRAAFLQNPPKSFDYRLGLSATPERQYDPEGTRLLFDFFGGDKPVFQFTLKDALGLCLVPYDYYIHLVELEEDEVELWIDLTDQLRRVGFKGEESAPGDAPEMSSKVKDLLRRRRVVIEAARNKINILGALLAKRSLETMTHTLIYTTDKQPDQIIAVNRLLTLQFRLRARQITAQETENKKIVTKILSDFSEGKIQVLTCKRVLDEGVNIPQVNEAFILASNTVKRQWIQRRGRLLRKCPQIEKEYAILHDFMVKPPLDADSRATSIILRQEVERATEFATLARNAGSEDGPFLTISKLMKI